MTERISASIDDEVYDRLQERLDYGDNRSAFITEAIRRHLDRTEA